MVMLPLCLAIAAGLLDMVFNFRHYSFVVPGYYLLVAIGWRRIADNVWAGGCWLAAATLISALALRANYTIPTKTDYRAGFAPLAQNYKPGDCVANRPRRFRNRQHLGWEVYYRDISPQLVSLDADPIPAECARLWVIWDKTWWMNLRPDVQAEDELLQQRLRDRYGIAVRYPRRDFELEMFVIRPLK
jgi:hypothetical protein